MFTTSDASPKPQIYYPLPSISPFLDLYLSPVRTPKNTPPTHWILILALPNGLKCTFYHIIEHKAQAPQDPTTTTTTTTTIRRYTNPVTRKTLGLHSSPPISTGLAELNKIGTIPAWKKKLVLRCARRSLGSYKNAFQSWAVTFLHCLQEVRAVPVGVSMRYKLDFEGAAEGTGC
ncbi:hypothetical protein BDW59DRAFT_160359 [Aspergillus cavernicola]|uniref:Uncharacterized protein n=1 Tax=Aspergillus cavernicola TaxID=176166 RepID=A0ABR4IKH1_9EURO